MALMDFFRTSPAQTQQAPAQQAPAQGQQPSTTPEAKTDTSGNHSNTTTPNQPVNPLDAYAKMYDNANKATPEAAPKFALDSKTVGEVTSSLDFTKDLPQDLMSKALAGDAQALIQAMNMVGRNAYQTSLQHSAALTDRFVGSRLEFEGKQLGSKVKSELTSSALSTAPNYQHPVVKAELNRIANMLAAEHPDATPQQIAESAQKYLMDVTNAVNPSKPAETAASQGKETDWSAFLS